MSYAVVTGAGSGMGRIYAKLLAEKGYGIIAVDINPDALDSLSMEMESAEIIKVQMDLSAPNAAQRIKEIADSNNARVEVLVNNAGMLFVTPIVETAPGKLATMMQLHCVTPLLLCRAFVPQMQERGCGYVLNVSSICAWMAWPLIGMYGNTKRFVKSYSRSLRIECRGTGVSVTTAVFGAVDTPLFGFPEKMRKWMLRLGVMISPETAASKALNGMFKRRKRVFPGLLNHLIVVVSPLLPDALLSRLATKYGKYLK